MLSKHFVVGFSLDIKFIYKRGNIKFIFTADISTCVTHLARYRALQPHPKKSHILPCPQINTP